MIRIAIIIGSTRPGRNGEAVGRWVYDLARQRHDAGFELVDLQTFNLPLLDEPVPPMMGEYRHPHTRAWAAQIASFDAFVFVTPEYNHSMSAALKNAIDYLYREWNDKAAGFVGYGGSGALRAVEQLRLVLAEVKVATVRNQVALSFHSDFTDEGFRPHARHTEALHDMLDQLIAWGGALQALREKSA